MKEKFDRFIFMHGEKIEKAFNIVGLIFSAYVISHEIREIRNEKQNLNGKEQFFNE